MSVPEGTMRVVTTRHDVWMAVSAFHYLLSGKTPPEGFLTVLKNRTMPSLNAYLEITDGPPPVTLYPSPETEESLG